MKVKAKPVRNCYMCGGSDWWWNGYDWTCSVCHPNPNVDKYKEPDYEKPIVEPVAIKISTPLSKDAESLYEDPQKRNQDITEVIYVSKNPEEAKLVNEACVVPLEDLFLRVQRGNLKTIEFYENIKKDPDSEKFVSLFESNVRPAVGKLMLLCNVLMQRGFNRCLYSGKEEYKFCKEAGIHCWVCTSKDHLEKLIFDDKPRKFKGPRFNKDLIKYLEVMGGEI